jgi:hypothetical protein
LIFNATKKAKNNTNVIIPLYNIYSTYIEIRLVETIPRDIYQNIVFPSQQYHISVIRNSQDLTLIHLFPMHKGDMNICSPEKNHIYDYFEGEQSFISPLCKGNECFIPPGQRFGEFCLKAEMSHVTII